MPNRINLGTAGGLQQRPSTTADRLGGNLSRLAGGEGIQKASDNAAGLAISEKLRSRISSLDQAAKNAISGSALVRSAEGGLAQIGDILSRVRELAVQASSGTLDNAQKASINREFRGALEEIDRVTATAEFNGTRLLSGDLGPKAENPVSIQVGTENRPEDRITIDTIEETNAGTLGVSGLSVNNESDARNALNAIDKAIGTVAARRAGAGVLEGRFQTAIGNIATTRENLIAAESGIRDTDYASETSGQVKNRLLLDTGADAIKKVGEAKQNLIGGLLNIKG